MWLDKKTNRKKKKKEKKKERELASQSMTHVGKTLPVPLVARREEGRDLRVQSVRKTEDV